jgi:hypothetical protein
MQNSQLPLKWYKPFAADDANKVEIPVTTASPLRASQSLGFPPLTMQPPESGGVPPEGEDFNGAMNQVARIAWWLMAGGALPFDAAWTADANIGGYPQGAVVAAADLQGEWISTADNNTNNPDTVGTAWVPGYNYGSTSLTGLTNANVTLTPAQAAKETLRLAGTLTGNIQIILPTWLKSWTVINNCTGAFSVTCKTAAGSGVVISQGGGSQIVWGDGTNLIALSGNSAAPLLVGPATLPEHALQLSQATGRLLGVQRFVTSGTYTPTSGTKFVIVTVVGAGGAGGGGFATGAAAYSVGSGGASGSLTKARFNAGFAGAAVAVGAGGTGVPGGAGNPGGASSFGGTLITAPGGGGGLAATVASTGSIFSGQGSPGGAGTVTGGGQTIQVSNGQPGSCGYAFAGVGPISGHGASSCLGGGGGTNTSAGAGGTGQSAGAGGGGAACPPSVPDQSGGVGAAGLVLVEEYA